jgi:large subunit ribosomal protein L10
LVAQLLGVLNGPVRGLVTVLSGTNRSLVYALDAIRKQKEEQSA